MKLQIWYYWVSSLKAIKLFVLIQFLDENFFKALFFLVQKLISFESVCDKGKSNRVYFINNCSLDFLSWNLFRVVALFILKRIMVELEYDGKNT